MPADAVATDGRYRVGVDIGGTFTDCVVIDNETGSVVNVVKTPTTPDDQSRGFLAGVSATGVGLDDVDLVLHGCTVGLNAIITRTGASTGLLTTAGLRDVIAMGRGQRPPAHQFNPAWRREFGDAARPFVSRHLRRPVAERMSAAGEAIVPLDEGDLRRETEFLVAQGVEAIAVCFINAYANPEHEARAKELVAEIAPDVHCWTSSEVHPCFKEYPRFSTCVLNTYVGPLIDRYFERTERALSEGGYAKPLMIMQSNGGVLPADMARERPAYTLQSGPTAGVAAARHWSSRLDLEQVLTLDIGGTSADYAIIDQGEPVMTTELELSHDVLVALPAVDVHSIGAGGGSVAWIDPLGALRVGPQSAGSVPGPACYGRGGTEPTVTDAFVATGMLPPQAFEHGAIDIHPELAEEALAPIAHALGSEPAAAGEAVLKVAQANLVEAAREVSVYSGVDPRGFALYVYGAAGPLFGSRVARELGVREAVIPPLAGTLSAFGLALSEVRLDLSHPLVEGLGSFEAERLSKVYEELEDRAREALDDADVNLVRWLDGRYKGQTWETPSVPVPAGALDAKALHAVRRNFDATHKRLWGYSLPDFEVTAMMARVTAMAETSAPRKPARAVTGEGSAVVTTRAFIDGTWHEVQVFDRQQLPAGRTMEGPAVIIEETTTVVLAPGDRAQLDELGHIRIGWEEQG